MNALELKFKKMGTAQLLTKISKLIGEEKEACLCVLKQRGQDISKWEENSSKITPEVSSVKIFEAEPEEELTEEEIQVILKSEEIKLPDPKDEKKGSKPETVKSKVKEKLQALLFPEGFTKGMEVKFIASKMSKTPGKELQGSLKRYTYDKQDACFYFVVNVEGKEYYKRPNSINKV